MSEIISVYIIVGMILVIISADFAYHQRLLEGRRVDAFSFVVSGLLTVLLWPVAVYRTINGDRS